MTARRSPGRKVNSGMTLTDYVRLFPTAADRPWNVPVSSLKELAGRLQTYQAATANTWGRGKPNPPWVEWILGWPMGWTDCRRSGTASAPSSQSSSDGAS